MIYLQILIAFIVFIFGVIFISAAVITVFHGERPKFIPNWVLLIGVICSVILFSFGFCFMVMEKNPEPRKYELIQEPVYRQVK